MCIYTHPILFIHLSTDEHILAIVNKAAINMGVHMCLSILLNSFLPYDTLQALCLVKAIIPFFVVWFEFLDVSSFINTCTLKQSDELGLVS